MRITLLMASTAAAASFLTTLWVVRQGAKRSRWLDQSHQAGPQKFHAAPVPRVGGVGVYAGLWLAAGAAWWAGWADATLALLLLACAVPAFAAGLLEDLTKKVTPRMRLLACGVSAGLALLALGAQISRADVEWLDDLVAWAPWLTVALTVVGVAGVASSVNIIDGFNGLASMCVMLILLAVAFVAWHVGDLVVMRLALACVAAVLGFFLLNYPAGLIFLGDGGAYFLGFMVAELAILLVHRNADVSPMFGLMVCVYPIFETLFSMVRRKLRRGRRRATWEPDGIHLHSLLFRRVVRWAVGGARNAKALNRRNSMTSPYLWALCGLSILPAVSFYDDTEVLLLCLLAFSVLYVGLYLSIVRFKTPRWLFWLGRLMRR
jgi:UDP-N-acetylmuramyl pentapeptide phosphotransferase/UDP-N-acetylglucosamine-1-phosphate transferase